MDMLFILLSFLFTPSHADSDPAVLRNKFHLAIYDEKEAEALANILSGIQNKSALQTGYQGANNMLQAKYALFPADKFRKFSQGKLLLEKAIQQEPRNIELIYLRHSIQTHCPAFLKYNQHLQSDRKTLIQAAAHIPDRDLRKHILTLILTESKLTVDERKALT